MSTRIVELKSLKPNPMRDFRIDPIDQEAVEQLKQSIKEDGFWGGVTARRARSGEIEIAAGHHRVEAAKKAGIREANIFVNPNWTDEDMIRVYARENATQRGTSGTAQAGSVAAVIRIIAKAASTGTLGQIFPKANANSLGCIVGQFNTDGTIGWITVSQFLENVPGFSESSAKLQIANLRASGDYARIIDEVREEIEREHKEAIKAMERAERERLAAEDAARKAEEERKEATRRARAAKEEADRKRAEAAQQKAEVEARLAEKRRKEMEQEAAKFDALRTTVNTVRKAADKANDREITFDFEGVAAILKNSHQIDVFRTVVTSNAVLPYLSVKRQAALAKQLVKQAQEQGAELTGAFIKQNVISLVLGVEEKQRKISRDEREKIKIHDWESRAREYQGEFSRSIRGALAAAKDIIRHNEKRPENATFHHTGEFSSALDKANELCKLLKSL